MTEKTNKSSYLIRTEKGLYFTTITGSWVTSVGRIKKEVQVTCLEWFEDNRPIGTDEYYNTHVYTGNYNYCGEENYCRQYVSYLEDRIINGRG